jgi:ankyrin repeat protein
MHTGQLPERPHLDQLRRQARELRDAARAGNPPAIDRVRRHLPGLAHARLTLAAAQLVIAREHGFRSWPSLKAEVESRVMDLESRVDAFLEASVEGRLQRAARLLAADPRAGTFEVSTAAVLGDAKHVRALIGRAPSLAVRPDHRRGWPPLLYVCSSRWHQIEPGRQDGMLEVARLLLDAGASPNTTSSSDPGHGYRSALSGAAGIANNPAITRLLLERGADPNDGESVYHAVFHRDHACLRLLVEHGAKVNGTNALPAVIGRGDVEAVRILLEAGADPGRAVREPAPSGHLADMTINPLPAAAARDSAAVVEALLAAGADPSSPCRDGRSPLRAAVRRGALDVAQTLLRHGARDDAGEIDYFIGACATADRAEAEHLLALHRGLMERMTDEDRAAIVDAAESAGKPAVALMLDLGFPIDVRRQADGGAALHVAAYRGRIDLVQLLIERGASLDRRDLQWKSTPLCWATVGSGELSDREAGGDWPATVQALLDAGASRHGVWVAEKPPSDDVAALLHAYGITGDETQAEESKVASDPAQLRLVAEQLRTAFDAGELDVLGSLLHPDVRWGAGPGGCHNRAQVLEWYQVLQARGVRSRVSEALLEGDAIVLGLAVTRPPGAPHAGRPETTYQVFKVSGGAIVEIRGYPDRKDALAGARGM